MNPTREKTRDEYIYLAKLYERAEKHEDMVNAINKFVIMNPVLNIEERNILSAGYKNIIGNKRVSWRYLQSQANKEDKKKNFTNAHYIDEIKQRVENEMKAICNQIQDLLDNFLVPNAQITEMKVFFLKLKADYFRYQCEFSKEVELENACLSAEMNYKNAYDLAESELPISSSTRLGLALNYSVMLFEIKGMKHEASHIAKKAFEESVKILDDLEKNKSKDAILIIQLLKENLILWNTDEYDDDMLN